MTEPEQPRQETPEQPRNLPPIVEQEEPRVPRPRARRSKRTSPTPHTSWPCVVVPFALFGVLLAAILLAQLFQGPTSSPQLPPAYATLTVVARYVATVRADLHMSPDPINTPAALSEHSTSTALARALAATQQVPPTETARAHAFETARAAAEATVGVLTTQATPVFGPTNGTLTRTQPEQAACDAAGTSLRNFIAEATFRNPTASTDAWNYGLTFTNSGDSSEYRLIVSSEGTWALNLHSDAFDVTNSDDTVLLDIAPGASNTLKLYVIDDTALLYINNYFADTLDLSLFEMGQSADALHDISVCTGINARATPTSQRTSYENFTVRSLP